jgi:hypothetical protein
MADKVKVQLAHPYEGKNPGDTVSYDGETARMLIAGGWANPATVAEAGKVGADPDTAATKK